MSDRLLSSADMQFFLHDWLKLDRHLDALETGHDIDTVDAYIDLSERLARDSFLPHYKLSDQKEPFLDESGVHVLPEIAEALKQFAELGMFSASFDEELGGMGLPYLVTAASYAWIAAANGGTAGYAMLTGANARLISAFGSPAQIEKFALPQIEGRWFGTMCLSEPQAGSGLADIRTKAVHQDDDELGGRYALSGNKMWISGGDQDISENIIHLVLAKVPDENGNLPEGTAGISLFIVPKIMADGSRNDVTVAGLNHKMGNRGTSNCLLNFGEGDGAVGWMVGAPGQGLRQMFMMMNEARIAVGMGAAALANRGYLLAVDYARERLQGQLPGSRDSKPVAIIHHADVKRMLLSAKAHAEGSMALCLYASKLVDERGDAQSQALLGLLTPIAKTYPSHYGLLANDIAIQIHGGYGYTRDFDVEQLYRDNRLNPIHEGTSGIQANDLLGRKILQDRDNAFAVLEQRIQTTCRTAAGSDSLRKNAEKLEGLLSETGQTIETVRQFAPQNWLNNSGLFLDAFGHLVVAWLWLDVAVELESLSPANEDQENFKAGKLAAMQFFFEFELPKANVQLQLVSSGTDTVSSAQASVF